MNLALQPFEFWLAVLVLLVGLVVSLTQLKRGVGIPMAAVLATISIWYVGDVLYNDYERIHLRLFAPSILAEAWMQVIIFLTVFIVTAPTLNIVVNGKILRRTSSQVLKLTPAIVGGKSFQDGLDVLLRAALIGWVAIIGLAVFRYQSRLISYFIPLIGGHPGPWVVSVVRYFETEGCLT